MVKVKLICSPD